MKKLLLPLLLLFLVASCSIEHDDFSVREVTDSEVIMNKCPYETDGSRMSITNTGTSLKFAWEEDDKVGLYSLSRNNPSMASYVFNSSADGSSLLLADNEWKWYAGTTYVAYYPYNPELVGVDSYKRVPVDMTSQRQRGNASTLHIGKEYDYMYSSGTIDKEGNLQLDFKHLCGILILDLKMPGDIIWKEVTISSEAGDVFTSKATMNALTGTVTGKEMCSSVSLELDDVKGDELTLYMSVLPCTTGDVVLTVTSAAGRKYTSKLSGKAIRSGRAYRWTATPQSIYDYGVAPSYVKAVDLGLPSGLLWSNMNLGATYEAGKGHYFAWGEVAEQSGGAYSWKSYKFSQNGSWTGITKYTYPDGQTTGLWYQNGSFVGDGKTILDNEDDAASVYWKGDWRMPSYEDIQELIAYTTAKWSNNYGGYGMPGLVVTSKVNGNVIFFTTSGSKRDGSLRSSGTSSYIWSSSLRTSGRGTAYYLGISSGGLQLNSTNRYYGCPVRAVM